MSAPWTPGPWQLTPCGDILGNRNTPQDNGLVCAMCEDRKDAEGAANARLIAEAPAMAEELEQAAAVFEHYADLHRAKGTPDGEAKGAVNAKHALRIRALLARVKAEG